MTLARPELATFAVVIFLRNLARQQIKGVPCWRAFFYHKLRQLKSEEKEFVRLMISTQKPNDISKDFVIKKLKGELMKTKKLLSCSDDNRTVLYQRLDDSKKSLCTLQSCYESLKTKHEELQLAHQALASKSLVLAKQWQLLREQPAQAATA